MGKNPNIFKFSSFSVIIEGFPILSGNLSLRALTERYSRPIMDFADRTEHEEMLRRAVLGGNELAWHSLYEATFDELHHYVLWRSGGRRDLTDEIVQETWLTAVRRIRRFDPRKGSFLAWMRGLSVNVLRHHLRRQRRKSKHELAAAGNGSTAISMEIDDRTERIAAALDALPERDEDVLRAKYLEGLSVAEIAARWNETPKAVESLLSRAREKFRKCYEK
jgi:RNA polymerase sigma-70 factor (ECF subfamily)